ncbi:MAG: chlorite dismutase family protein [Terriglobales bacterium]
MPERTQRDSEARRQVISLMFYKAAPEWRRLPAAEKQERRRDFLAVVDQWQRGDEMKVLTYSLVGLRADCDMMLWRICYSLECLQQMQAQLMQSGMGAYLATPHSFLAMTRRSQYQIGRDPHHGENAVRCGVGRYATIVPFDKTRNWYQVPFPERQRIVNEYIDAIAEFPRVRMNTLYSFGLDDPEFVLVFESDNPADMVDLKMRLRDTENSNYVLRDSPAFTCIQCTPEEMLERLG